MAGILKGQSGQPIQFETQPTINGSLLVKDAVNATGDAPIYACRAWVNFDGTRDVNGNASTANTARLIRSSGNVTSVVRNGTGDYTINFTEPFSDSSYGANLSTTQRGSSSNANQSIGFYSSESTGEGGNVYSEAQLRIMPRVSGGSPVDTHLISVSIFR